MASCSCVGEEDEDAVFSQRSKLFRFDKDTSAWKEKGIGEMKILKHKTTGGYRPVLALFSMRHAYLKF